MRADNAVEDCAALGFRLPRHAVDKFDSGFRETQKHGGLVLGHSQMIAASGLTGFGLCRSRLGMILIRLTHTIKISTASE
jgi:hypothetical protein